MSHRKKLVSGVYTALITPFDTKGKLDEKGLVKLIKMQINNDVDGILCLGTTAESPTLTEDETKKIITLARKEITKPIKLMVGCGSNSTDSAIAKTKIAEKLGADSILSVVPYYNRPTQEGLYLHFKAIAKATKLPIILYNIPSRTSQNLEVKTILRLAEIKNIVGIKECSGSFSQTMDIIHEVAKIRSDFSILSGDDISILPLIALGGDGIISVMSNLIPDKIKLLVENALEGDFEGARKIHNELLPLIKAAFIETNPAPIKAMMNLLKLPAGPCRLPLAPLTPESLTLIKKIIHRSS